MARGRRYPIQTRAAVVASLLSGQSPEEVSELHKVPVGTVRDWWRQAGLSDESPSSADIEPVKKREIGALVADYLQETMTTLVVQVRHCRNPEWLARQDAHQLGTLHGILSDKSVRLLAALREPVSVPDGDGDQATAEV